MVDKRREVSFEVTFRKKISKLKDSSFKEKIKKQIRKIIENPNIGKPMKNVRKGTREIYISPYRISYIFSINDNEIIFLDLYHKDSQ